MKIAIITFATAALMALVQAPAFAKTTPARLRCEYLTNPLAVQTDKPRLSWILESNARAVRQSAYQILVATVEKALKPGKADLWDSGKVASAASAHIVYAGKALASDQQAVWKVRVWTGDGKASRWSSPASWRTGKLRPDDWIARWVSAREDLPEGDPTPAQPSPFLRKVFDIPETPKKAVLAASALGLFEIRINGEKVGDSHLAPEWTDYNKRVQYQAYDVTRLLRKGKNVIGAVLGEGWYAGRIGISHIVPQGRLRNHYGRRLALLAELRVELQNGKLAVAGTDESWKATSNGPILRSCILDGEVHDARKELTGWDAATFDDASWQPVEIVESSAKLVAQPNEPIRVTEELRPVAVREPSPGIHVFDFGQNIAGVCRIRIRGKAGTTLTLRHAEVLAADGTIYRDNLRMAVYAADPRQKYGKYLGARQEDQYTLRGGEAEIFEPRFTYHGFRYVEVTGLEEKPPQDFIVARVLHSAPPAAGTFSTSSELLNKLMRNIVWTLRDNLHGVPTDCPQRDERLGWMGDMLVFAQPASFIMDMAAFFTKWSQDIRDAQAKDGRYPDFAPHPFDPDARFSGVPAWGDAGVFIPWNTYINYGDRRILEEHFESARRWVDWILAQNPDRLWRNKRHNDYGDWLNGDTLKLEGFGYPKGGSQVPKEIFGSAFFHQSAKLVSKMAGVLGRDEDADRYGKLADQIREAFQSAYVREDGEIRGDTQAGYALALGFDLLPEEKRDAAVERMVKRIRDYRDHISTGFHSTIHLMNELTRRGQNDLAYTLINNRSIPSWGYTIDQGATTIWERWDGYVEGRGFQDPGMNSFNHYAIGSVSEWMYRTILGIHPDESKPGYERFTLKPRPGGGLTWARGSYDSIRGKIESRWQIEGERFEFDCTIPPNTLAIVSIPAADAAQVTEGGKPAARAKGLRFLRLEEGAALFEAQSGSYRFQSKMPKIENLGGLRR